MATRIRDGVPGKEKALPQQGNPPPRRAGINPSPSPSRPIAAKSTAPSSDRGVPSNPKPTRTRLSIDKPTQPAAAKKPVAAAAAKKPVATAAAATDKSSLTRLRSFDKSSPPISPSPRTRQPPNPKEKIMRPSSSFSGSRSTGTTLQKGASNRIVKPAAKKSNNATTNKYGGSTASSASSARVSRSSSIISSPERVEDPEIVNVPHAQEDDPQTSVMDEEISTNALSSHVTNEQVPLDVSSKHEMTAAIVKEEKQKTDPPVQAKPDIHEQKDIKITESLKSEGSNKTETKDQNTPGKETSGHHLESQQLQEQIKDNRTDPVNENLEVRAEEQGKEEVKDAIKEMKKKEEVKKEDQVTIMKETKDVKNIASLEPVPKLKPQSEPALTPSPAPAPAPAPEEKQTVEAKRPIIVPEPKLKPQSEPALTPAPAPAPAPEETQTVEAKRPIIVQGKKDAAAVSNDAIEETASKLQEQKKNRVRALAGAFESVMK